MNPSLSPRFPPACSPARARPARDASAGLRPGRRRPRGSRLERHGLRAAQGGRAAARRDHDAFGDDIVEHPRAAHPSGADPGRLAGSRPAGRDRRPLQRCRHRRRGRGDYSTKLPRHPFRKRSVAAEPFEPESVAQIIAVVPAPIAPAPRRAPRPRAAAGTKAKAAFTLRLDPERHLKLRLACAVDGRSAQQLVTTALDHLLERMPEVDGLAAKAKSRG